MTSKGKREKENSAKDLKKRVTSSENAYKMQPGANDGSTSDATSCISFGDATSSIKESEVDPEALMAAQCIYYPVNGVYGYYYPGFDGSPGDWDDNGYLWGNHVLELQVISQRMDQWCITFLDFCPYGSISPANVVGVDGECLTQQLYYSSPMYHQTMVSPSFLPQAVAYGPEHAPAFVWDIPAVYADGLHGNDFGRDSAVPYAETNYSCQNGTLKPSKVMLSSSSAFRKKGAAAVPDSSQQTASQSQVFRSINKVNDELSKSIPPSNKIQSISGCEKDGLLSASVDNAKEAGRTLAGTKKQKAAYKTQEACTLDLLDEQNRGQRTSCNHSVLVTSCESTTVPGTSNNNGSPIVSIKKEDYNTPDFDTKYDHALFFIIKSYSEDDIHKSIKYGVWASTPNGNRRLDIAFQVAREKVAEKGCKCPVFLFFSVNASGQFCGVAEMIGQVDFNKNMDFWQQDKWNGYFPVKWHIIKDIPNRQFRHIILENNDNKPVTNSRDTQEVKFPQGTEMLNIFKNYTAKTSILDDFDFYESREKAMQEKRTKPTIAKFEYLTLNTEAAAKAKRPADLKCNTQEESQAGSDTSAKE
ncbi:hypothetical protein HPP92_005279 [Vanilla planifolia]|uniref:YTH domain-containing family protein n=1 Tax=Vanilla planifolia TaxID=51239 RepID=A0A835RN77_VANPL|nr:hypothetical protein HPP92_005279 [Vanilla planifolia]